MTRHSFPDERLLFEQIANGSKTAYRQIVQVYVPLLGPVVYGIVKSQLPVDDIIQETLLRIWICRDQLSAIDNPRAWIFRICYLQALGYLRSQKIKSIAFAKLHQGTTGESHETEHWLGLRSVKKLVANAVHNLPPQQKKSTGLAGMAD